MPRQSKPYFRQQTKSWYCSIGGKQIPLGKNKTEAHEKFYELMGRKDDIRADLATVYELTQTYLDWCQQNKKPSTYTKHLHYLKSFVESTGKRLKVSQVRKLHLTKWFEKQSWSSTTQNDAMGVVKRAFNWATEEGYFIVEVLPAKVALATGSLTTSVSGYGACAFRAINRSIALVILLIDPGMCQVGHLTYQRKFIATERQTGLPAVIGLVDPGKCHAVANSIFSFIAPDGCLDFSQTHFVNRTILGHDLAPRLSFLRRN